MKYKLVLLGDTSVGKSCIVLRLVRDEFYNFQEPTIGSAFMTYNLNDDVRFDIWDTAGQERYRTLAPMYYRCARVGLVVYDITKKDTFEGAKYWIQELNMNAKNIIIILVGNKIDRENDRQVMFEEAKSYAEEQKIMFFETSAKKNINIKNIFTDIASKIPNEEQVKKESNNSLKIEKDAPKKSCC